MRTRAKDDKGNIVFIDQAQSKQIYYDDMFENVQLIPVKGEIKKHHFRYKDGFDDQDTWADRTNSMSEWHISQQSLFPIEEREVPIFPHRADVLTGGNTVIEFQHSWLSAEEIEERTTFYIEKVGAIIWVVDGTDNIRKCGKHTYRFQKRSFIGGIKIRPQQEVFIYTGWPDQEYIHVRKENDSWDSFNGYELGIPHFLMYATRHIPNRVFDVANFWDSLILKEKEAKEKIEKLRLQKEQETKKRIEYIESQKVKEYNSLLDQQISNISKVVESFTDKCYQQESEIEKYSRDIYFWLRTILDIRMQEKHDSRRD